MFVPPSWHLILQILSSQAQQEAECFIWSIRPFEVKMSRILRHSPNFSNRFVTNIYLGEIVEIYNMNEEMSTNPRMLTYPPGGGVGGWGGLLTDATNVGGIGLTVNFTWISYLFTFIMELLFEQMG